MNQSTKGLIEYYDLIKNRDLDSAKIVVEKAITYYEAKRNKKEYATSIYFKGIIFLKQNQLDSALFYFQISKENQKLVQDYEDSIQKMDADLQAMISELDKVRAEKDQLITTNGELSQQLQNLDQTAKPKAVDLLPLAAEYWYVIAGAVLALLLGGFLLGKSVIESHVKRRFQGVKVW